MIPAQDDAARAHAGQATGLGVDADGLGQDPERGAPLEEAHEDDSHDRKDEGEGKPEDVAAGDELQRGAVDRRDEATGDEQGYAAAGEHQHQGGDDRLNSEQSHEQAVPHAQREGDGQPGSDGDEHGADAPGVR